MKKTSKFIKRGNVYQIPLKDGFLPRFIRRGYSDQVNVPQDLHEKVTNDLISEFKQKYGDNFADIVYQGIEEDIQITIYIK